MQSVIDLVEMIQPAAILAMAAGLLGVVFQISGQRKLTKQNNSIAVLMELREDAPLKSAMEVVAEVFTKERGKMVSLAFGIESGEDQAKHRALMAVIDYFEAVSVGIRHNIYDKDIIRECARNEFLVMFGRTKPFIRAVRQKQEQGEKPDSRIFGEMSDKIDLGKFGKNFEEVAEEFANSAAPEY